MRSRSLQGFAITLGIPEREKEFLDKAEELAWTDLDRYRFHIMAGGYYDRRGLTPESVDHFNAAQGLFPALPDAYYADGLCAVGIADFRGGQRSPVRELDPVFDHRARFTSRR